MNGTDEEMLNQTLKVEEVDAVEIISIVDNSVDFLSTIDKKEVQSFRQWTKERHRQGMDKKSIPNCLLLNMDLQCSSAF